MEPEVMSPRTNKIDIVYPQNLVDRVDRLAEMTGEARNAIFRRAAALGVGVLESEYAQQIAFENALAVKAKLSRRGKNWEEAIEILRTIDSDQVQAAIELLKRSAGGE